jgi:hypothetical protein
MTALRFDTPARHGFATVEPNFLVVRANALDGSIQGVRVFPMID